jgi:hypothetical protein
MQKLRAIALAAVVGVAAISQSAVNLRQAPHAEGVRAEDMAAPSTPKSVSARLQGDLDAMQAYRPGYAFWRHVFTIPDGRVVFGSATDGRRLAVLKALSSDARESVASELEAEFGPVLHNSTRGSFVAPGRARYGRFLQEWGAIYERFGVPANVGLAQAMLESGFVGARKSEAGAIGLCQWLEGNWKSLDRIDPTTLEIENQTTQAAYCAAYVSILATKYDSFIPALSAHHAGGTNVGRVLVNGDRLGGETPRSQYFLGSKFAIGLRNADAGKYKDIYGSYGPRSYLYAEMVFGNIPAITDAITEIPQSRIFAMRTPRAIPIAEIATRTGLPVDEIRRYNPALVKKVPAGATLYLPKYDSAFGRDVSFWARPAPVGYTVLLRELVSLDAPPDTWDTPAFRATLADFEGRFRDTETEEGTIMATVLAYVRGEALSRRREILAAFRESDAIANLFAQAAQTLAE